MGLAMPLAQRVQPVLAACLAQNDGIELIALATVDGFGVCAVNRNGQQFEQDKMAAAASTLFSVSDAVAKQILNKRFNMTFIETESGNIVFVAMTIEGSDYVLAMSANSSLNIASLRLYIKRLADDIAHT